MMSITTNTVSLMLIIFAQFLISIQDQDVDGIYKIGTGIGDVTGPGGGVVLNGYVNPITLAAGIHTRLYARSFIVESITTGESAVFVTCDLGMLDHGIKLEVIKKLNATFGGTYTEKNVMLSATHTHSGPSGYMQYYAYLIIESQGFNPLSFWAIVDGIVDSISMAHAALTPGKIYKNKGELLGCNRNRNTQPYLENPAEERNLYQYDVDKNMTLLRFEAIDGTPLGAFNWFSVHPISFNGAFNPLVSSDNRGYGSILFDYRVNGIEVRPGSGKFVAGFASANLGDSSPSSPPGCTHLTDDMANVCRAGTGQFEKAWELYSDPTNLELVKGPVGSVQQYVDMTDVKVMVKNPETGLEEEKTTCKPAMGYAFVGIDPEQQEFWDPIFHLLKKPSPEMVECQLPKIVAIAAGEMDTPWAWAPAIADFQILRIGNVDLVGAPGELTTMAGRRLKRKVQEFVPVDTEVIIAGLANNYINYVATPEEYNYQEYEAGATIYGKYTLDAIMKTHANLVTALNENEPVKPGPIPPNFIDRLRPKIPDLVDILPANRQWGQEVSRPINLVYTGQDLFVVFVTPSPRHDALRGKSHFAIQRQVDGAVGVWEDVRTDADVDTTFWWNALKRQGEVTWYSIPHDTKSGTYRVYHTGFYLEAVGTPLKAFEGYSEEFMLALHPSMTPTPGTSTVPTTVSSTARTTTPSTVTEPSTTGPSTVSTIAPPTGPSSPSTPPTTTSASCKFSLGFGVFLSFVLVVISF